MAATHRILVAGALALGMVLFTAACGSQGPSREGRAADGDLRIVATTSVLGHVLATIAGDHAEADVLMRAGTDPHAFEPSAAQVRAVLAADLVVANGLGLEQSLLDVLDAAEADGVEVLRVADHVDPRPFTGPMPEGHEEEDHDDDELDPHFWLDPVRMAVGVEVIAAGIGRVAPGAASAVERDAGAYREQLLELHGEIEAVLAPIPDDERLLVTNHEALGYFADRYGFQLVGTVVPGGSTLAEASTRDLARLAETIEDTGVPAIFVETTAPDRLAVAVSSEVEGRDVEVVTLHTGSLGPPGSGADTYVGMMRTNAERIADALAR